MWYDKHSMEPILIGLSPNSEVDDIALARQLLADRSRWHDESPIIAAEQQLSAILNGTPAVLTTSGRQALYLLLKAYGIGSGDEVIIQAFTCIAVPAPILWAGATPVYADIRAENYNLDPVSVTAKITPRTKAIVIQHTFGIPGPLPELRQLASQHKILLIEDCAHALRTIGDAAIFSFGRDKALSSVFGGAVATRDQAVMQRVRQYLAPLPAAPDTWVTQQLRHPLIFYHAKRDYFVGLGKIYIWLAQRSRLVSKAVMPIEKNGGQPPFIGYRPSPALAILLEQQLRKLPRFTRHRRDVAEEYKRQLAGDTRFTLPTVSTVSEPNWLRFPVQVSNPQEIMQLAKRYQMLLGDWYNTPVGPADVNATVFKYQAGSCPVAEEVGRRVLNLPTYPTLTKEQVKRVIDVVKKYVR